MTGRSMLPGVIGVLMVATLTGCSSGGDDSTAAGTTPRAEAAAATTPQAKQVLAISVDGLNQRAIRDLGKRVSNFQELRREGAHTLNARTEYETTRTLPNHTGMLTGRRVNASRGGHGVAFNDDNGGTTHRSAGERVSSVFNVVSRCGGSTALFSAKTKFRFFKRSWPSAIDRYTYNSSDGTLVRAAIADLRANRRAFTFLHLAGPDETGHAKGFMGTAYLRRVQRIDALLGRVMSAIKQDPELKKNLTLVLTADHGGRGGGHNDRTKPANYRVPLMAWGAGVEAGAGLYKLSPSYRGPGSARPNYAGRQPIRNGDLANLSTSILGWPAVPGSQFDERQELRVNRGGYASTPCGKS